MVLFSLISFDSPALLTGVCSPVCGSLTLYICTTTVAVLCLDVKLLMICHYSAQCNYKKCTNNCVLKAGINCILTTRGFLCCVFSHVQWSDRYWQHRLEHRPKVNVTKIKPLTWTNIGCCLSILYSLSIHEPNLPTPYTPYIPTLNELQLLTIFTHEHYCITGKCSNVL